MIFTHGKSWKDFVLPYDMLDGWIAATRFFIYCEMNLNVFFDFFCGIPSFVEEI